MLIQPAAAAVSSWPSSTRTWSHAVRVFHVLLSTLLQMVNCCPGRIAPIWFTSERSKGRNGNGLGLLSNSMRGFLGRSFYFDAHQFVLERPVVTAAARRQPSYCQHGDQQHRAGHSADVFGHSCLLVLHVRGLRATRNPQHCRSACALQPALIPTVFIAAALATAPARGQESHSCRQLSAAARASVFAKRSV